MKVLRGRAALTLESCNLGLQKGKLCELQSLFFRHEAAERR